MAEARRSRAPRWIAALVACVPLTWVVVANLSADTGSDETEGILFLVIFLALGLLPIILTAALLRESGWAIGTLVAMAIVDGAIVYSSLNTDSSTGALGLLMIVPANVVLLGIGSLGQALFSRKRRTAPGA